MTHSSRPPTGFDDESPSDRRISARHLACFPAYVQRPDGEKRTAMIHDLSVTGALLLVRTRLAIGDKIDVELFITGDSKESRVATGQIVRIEQLGPKATGIWTHRVAVHFDEPLNDYEAQIKALADRQEQLGLRP